MRAPLAVFCFALIAFADPQPPGELVSIGSGRIHIQCIGNGEPTVVFLNGVPRFSFHFALVAPEVGKFARAYVYDRVGEAWSDPLPGAPSAAATLDELDAVIGKVAGNGRVVLAGHSFGGVIARAYQRKYPQRVAGLVLIDSVPPDASTLPVDGKPKKMSDMTAGEIRAVAEQFGKRPRPAAPDPKVEAPFDRLPAALYPAHLWATKKWQDDSRKIDLADALQYQADFYRAIGDNFLGDLPLAVVSRAKSADDSSTWVAQQKQIAASSSRGTLVLAVGSGHDIELEQPDTVVAAIRTLVESVRRSLQ
jgi:pimeloyl-ACP methyl ester carboxylesterase